jgi:hypothetical protein
MWQEHLPDEPETGDILLKMLARLPLVNKHPTAVPTVAPG